MCLAFLGVQVVPGLPLVIAANRDEFYARPSAALDFWEDSPQILAGRDLQAGGTWFGVSRRGDLALITNRRGESVAQAPSRGRLVTGYLEDPDNDRFSDFLQREGSRYEGFNIIYGNLSRLFYYSNGSGPPTLLTPGIYGLSNDLLDTPWPKVVQGKARLQALPAVIDAWNEETLFSVLADREIPVDEEIPHTGLPWPLERALAAIFVKAPSYGTRSATVARIDATGMVTVTERSFERDPQRFDTRTRVIRP